MSVLKTYWSASQWGPPEGAANFGQTPYVRRTRNSDQSVSHQTDTDIVFTTVAEGLGSYGTTGPHTIITISGMYLIKASLRVGGTGSAGRSRIYLVRKPGGIGADEEISASVINNTALDASLTTISISIKRRFDAGDYVRLVYFHTAGVTATVVSDDRDTFMTNCWLGPV